MPFDINVFRNNLIYDGARPNLFEVNLNFPSIINLGGTAQTQSTFLVKSAQLPGSSIGQVPVYYFGRELKFAGNRTFADWTVQIINDEDFSIRNAFEQWLNAINSHTTNVRNSNALTPSSYTVDSVVKQYGKSSSLPIKSYKFVGMFPIDISPIDLDWSSNDSIEEYSVTFAYQWWESDGNSPTPIATTN